MNDHVCYIYIYMYVKQVSQYFFQCDAHHGWRSEVRSGPGWLRRYRSTYRSVSGFFPIWEGRLLRVCGRRPLSHAENNGLCSKASGFKYLAFLTIHVWNADIRGKTHNPADHVIVYSDPLDEAGREERRGPVKTPARYGRG